MKLKNTLFDVEIYSEVCRCSDDLLCIQNKIYETKYMKYIIGSVGDNVHLIYNGSSRAGDGGTTDKSIRKLTPPPKQRGPKKSSKEVETCLEKVMKQALQFS